MSEPLPFVDVHEVTIRASRSDVFDAARSHATKSLRFGARNPLPVLLGTVPRSGFSIEHLVEDEFIVLVGSHRFSQYQLRFDVDPPVDDGAVGIDSDSTRVRATTHAAFPGRRGRAYRAVVIGSGGHARLMRRMLHTIARAAESTPH